MDDWIDLPAGFADLAQANAWSKSLGQAKRRVRLLRLIELVFKMEALFEERPELDWLAVSLHRERPGAELCAGVCLNGEPAELDAWLAARRRRDPVAELGPLGPDEAKRSMERLRQALCEMEDLSRDEPGCLDGAGALRPYQTIRISRGRSSWREICGELGAQEASRAIERAQIEQETQSGRSRQEARSL